jgi:transcriptional regulator with XRE-family HTH domain
MTNQELRHARQQLKWTQKQAAAKLGVSQPYLSLLENGLRPVSTKVVTRLAKHAAVPATALPMRSRPRFDSNALAASLGALGYPRYSHLANAGRRENPAVLLLTALQQDELDPRLTEALPWLLLHYSKLNWEWLVDQAKRQNLQNRVGFLVALARELAEKEASNDVVDTLARWEHELEDARLAKTDALARRLTAAERRYFETNRSVPAAHWNLLTGLSADALDYAS